MRIQSLTFYFLSFMLLFIFIMQPEVDAESKQTYDVGTSNLNVRSAPSYDAKVVGHLDKGQQVNSFNEENGWIQTYYDGEIAWVATQYLIEAESDSKDDSSASDEVTVTATDVHVRSGPGTKHSVTGSATTGDTYKLLESKGNWVKVAQSQGDGWIYADLTDQASNDTSGDTDKSSKNQHIESSEKKAADGTLDGINIVLDPGHGGKDPGSIGWNNVQEKDLIDATSDKVAAHLQKKGATVIRTRPKAAYKTLDQRIGISNDYNTDAFVSIHYDVSAMPSVKGTSAYYYAGGADKQLAQNVQDSLVNVNEVHDRGIKHGNYKVLRENKDLGILIELGFISNPEELANIQSADFQERTAEAIADGLVDYFD